MEPRLRLPKNILEGIGQIPRFNLDFTKLPKAPIMPKAPVQTKLPVQPMPVTRGVSEVMPQPRIEGTAGIMPITAPPPIRQPVRRAPDRAPFAASIQRVESGLDPLTKQLLFGLGGKGGFIPGAMRAAEKVFFDEQGQPVVIEEQVAGLTPYQLRAQ